MQEDPLMKVHIDATLSNLISDLNNILDDVGKIERAIKYTKDEINDIYDFFKIKGE